MDWAPKKPKGFEFTPHRDGWSKWYRGQTRVLSVKSLDRSVVRAAWDERRRAIDAKIDDNVAVLFRPAGGVDLQTAASLFYEWLDHRVRTRQPNPLSPVTAEDYKRTINRFGRLIGPRTGICDIGPAHFKLLVDDLAGGTPVSFARHVAYIRAFFNWAKTDGHIVELPVYGSYFTLPTRQEKRDVRLSQEKSYTPAQLRLLWFHATYEEKLWVALGLCGALDNADLANLTTDVLDRPSGTLDYRRRKRGKIRRVIPLPAIVWELLKLYERPAPVDPADADLVLLTPSGLRLQRLVKSQTGIANPIDYVAMKWSRLMIRAGLRPPLPGKPTKGQPPRPRRMKARGSVAGQGFRSLRTTFPNLAPAGYRDEIEVIMGHLTGGVLVENYLERYGIDRLRECVDGVWHRAGFS